ncbi:uncharacterized protein LY89DRAFT_226161 [Mollisia scopiformis]|uniref:2EXR domain-containing protein n=1 Tax=Mollisia scopiformis TaxID=149040 RepID=A0A194WU42_MOLSC|nr:uncharacterized protein LY89DRAFT_226161 [Mollisia scopiformis]KUJ11475.1 hypothetical protein LY89DRAFT_226161 [Mollisia scopiformis]
MADSGTFTCFPRLPPEIRIAIWEKVANLPRNLDIWAPKTGEVTYSAEVHGAPTDKWLETFQYTTTQFPGCLLANQESRSATCKYFELSFEVGYQQDSLMFFYQPEIMSNVTMDRVCPMGWYSDEAVLALWSAETKPSSCAFNVFPPDQVFALEPLLSSPKNAPDEICYTTRKLRQSS